jgi:hypothetical protein
MTIDTELLTLAATVFVVATVVHLAGSVMWRQLLPGFGASVPLLRIPVTVGSSRAIPSRKLVKPRLLATASADRVHAKRPVEPSVDAKSVPDDIRAVRGSDRLSATAQIERIASLVGASVDRSSDVSRLHASAAQQLDLANYALQNLVGELAGVLPAIAAPAAAGTRTAVATTDKRLALAA